MRSMKGRMNEQSFYILDFNKKIWNSHQVRTTLKSITLNVPALINHLHNNYFLQCTSNSRSNPITRYAICLDCGSIIAVNYLITKDKKQFNEMIFNNVDVSDLSWILFTQIQSIFQVLTWEHFLYYLQVVRALK